MASTPTTPQLAVVIPASKEKANLEVLLPALRQVLASLGLYAEIYVVTRDADDGTDEVATRWDAKLKPLTRMFFWSGYFPGLRTSPLTAMSGLVWKSHCRKM